MKVFSVAYFNRGGSKRNSKGSSSSSSGFGSSSTAAAAPPGTGHVSGRSRDDRPFPPTSAAIPSGAYIISSPPRYHDGNSGGGGVTAQTSHTLQFVRGSAQHRGRGSGGGAAWRGSNPDLRRMNNSGFTIYDYEETSSGLSRGRRRGSGGSAGGMGLMSMRDPFQRSRSSSGGRRSVGHHRPVHCPMSEDDRGFVWPSHFYPALASNCPAAAATPTSAEPIYSEPLPPMTMRVREAEKKMVLKQSTAFSTAFSPDPQCDPAPISNHIYEYLVTRRSDASTHMADDDVCKSAKVAPPATLPKPVPLPVDSRSDSRSVPGHATRRRGSLSSSSPSSSAASSSSKRDSQDSNSGNDNSTLSLDSGE